MLGMWEEAMEANAAADVLVASVNCGLCADVSCGIIMFAGICKRVESC